MARPAGHLAAPSTGTLTLTLEESLPPSSSQTPETLVLRLRRPRKKVTWKEGTVDNEFLNRKSSKKCCIFHKQRSFDEDDSDTEDPAGRSPEGGDDGAGPSGSGGGCCSHGGEHHDAK